MLSPLLEAVETSHLVLFLEAEDQCEKKKKQNKTLFFSICGNQLADLKRGRGPEAQLPAPSYVFLSLYHALL